MLSCALSSITGCSFFHLNQGAKILSTSLKVGELVGITINTCLSCGKGRIGDAIHETIDLLGFSDGFIQISKDVVGFLVAMNIGLKGEVAMPVVLGSSKLVVYLFLFEGVGCSPSDLALSRKKGLMSILGLLMGFCIHPGRTTNNQLFVQAKKC